MGLSICILAVLKDEQGCGRSFLKAMAGDGWVRTRMVRHVMSRQVRRVCIVRIFHVDPGDVISFLENREPKVGEDHIDAFCCIARWPAVKSRTERPGFPYCRLREDLAVRTAPTLTLSGCCLSRDLLGLMFPCRINGCSFLGLAKTPSALKRSFFVDTYMYVPCIFSTAVVSQVQRAV